MSDKRQVEQVLARHVPAADRRSSADLAALFAPDAEVEILFSQDGISRPIRARVGADTIGHAVAGLMRPHPARGWRDHTTRNAIIEVRGDRATLDTPWVVFDTVGSPRPGGGWPDGAAGARRRIDGVWKITRHRITHDVPCAPPGA